MNLLISFILSFCSFSYEFLLIKISTEIIGDSFIWRSFIIGFFIVGLGLGAYKIEKKEINKNEDLLINEYRLIISAILTPFILFSADIISNVIYYYERFLYTEHLYDIIFLKENLFFHKIFFFSILILITSLIGYFTGKELPLLINKENELKTDKFLFFNYLGSLFSSIIMTFFVFNGEVTSEKGFLIIACINTIILFFLKIRNKLNFLIIPILMISVLYITPKIKKIFLYQKYHQSYMNIWEEFYDKNTDVIEFNTPYQKIDFVINKEEQVLYLNGNFQFSIGNEKDYHETMVHFPYALLNKNKKINVLLLGGGDGFLLRELFKYKKQLEITHIELDEDFLKFSKENAIISKSTDNSLKKEIYNRVFTDGFSYVKNTNLKYDFILIDFPYPYSYDLTKLYSKEFFESIKNVLSRKGIAIMDIPLFREIKLKQLYNRSKLTEINNIIYSTVYSVFEEKSLFFKVNEEGFVLLSKNDILERENIAKTSLEETLSSFKLKNLKFIKNQVFNFKYDKKLINSIYKPTIREFKSQHQK